MVKMPTVISRTAYISVFSKNKNSEAPIARPSELKFTCIRFYLPSPHSITYTVRKTIDISIHTLRCRI